MRMTWIILLAMAGACGDNLPGRPTLDYTNPKGGKLRLVKNDKQSTGDKMVLDLVVGDQSLTGYAIGFDLPLDAYEISLL